MGACSSAGLVTDDSHGASTLGRRGISKDLLLNRDLSPPRIAGRWRTNDALNLLFRHRYWAIQRWSWGGRHSCGLAS